MQSKNILIIEDEEAIRETLRLALEIQGYKVFLAANGREGLDRLSMMAPPGVVLLDLMMPVMDGWEFMHELAKRPAFDALPVVAITAFEEKPKTIRVKEIVAKPIALDQLFAIVARYCNG